MATRDENLRSMRRDCMSTLAYEPEAVIVGLSAHLGIFRVSSREKIRITDGVTDQKKEVEKTEVGLGVKSTTLSAPGENIFTAGALSLLKGAMLYAPVISDRMLSHISTSLVGSETNKSLSSAPTIKVTEAVNKGAEWLRGRCGIDLGVFNPHVSQFHQSACASAGVAVGGLAENGISDLAAVTGVDDAKYQARSKADLTPGFYAVTTFVGRAGKFDGIPIDPRSVCGFTYPMQDFEKRVHPIGMKDDLGIATVSLHPVVFGKESEQAYLGKVPEAIAASTKSIGVDLDTVQGMREFLNTFLVAPHQPYAAMTPRVLRVVVQHAARVDPEFGAELRKELPVKEPFLNGFKSLREQYSFITDFNQIKLNFFAEEELYSRSKKAGLAEQIMKMMGGMDDENLKNQLIKFVKRVDKDEEAIGVEMLTRNKGKAIGVAVGDIERMKRRYTLDSELGAAVDATEQRLINIREKCYPAAKEFFGDVRKAFEPVELLIVNLVKEESFGGPYNQALMKTSTYRRLYKEFQIDALTKETSQAGNGYAASQPLGFESLLAHTSIAVLRTKRVINVVYGSGLQVGAYVADTSNTPNETLAFIAGNSRTNLSFEKARQTEVTGETSLGLRSGKISQEHERIVPMSYHMGFLHVNEKGMEREFEPYIRHYNSLRERGPRRLARVTA